MMVIGGELHSDEEAVLLDQGSEQQYLWGINIYPAIRQKIKEIVKLLIREKEE